ncbi:MAG: hypothetical protein JWR25_1179 [Noviherbaspirillum sp.]|jgi:hypothetical protein|nr:hypothetical protein [Noviherbaspirillum sp.]
MSRTAIQRSVAIKSQTQRVRFHDFERLAPLSRRPGQRYQGFNHECIEAMVALVQDG